MSNKHKINQAAFYSYIANCVEIPDDLKGEIAGLSKDLHRSIERDLMDSLKKTTDEAFGVPPTKGEIPTYPSKLTAQQYDPPAHPYKSKGLELPPMGFYAHKFNIAGA